PQRERDYHQSSQRPAAMLHVQLWNVTGYDVTQPDPREGFDDLDQREEDRVGRQLFDRQRLHEQQESADARNRRDDLPRDEVRDAASDAGRAVGIATCHQAVRPSSQAHAKRPLRLEPDRWSPGYSSRSRSCDSCLPAPDLQRHAISPRVRAPMTSWLGNEIGPSEYRSMARNISAIACNPRHSARSNPGRATNVRR